MKRIPTHEVEGWCDDEACQECCYHMETDHLVCMSCGMQLESGGYESDEPFEYAYEGDN